MGAGLAAVFTWALQTDSYNLWGAVVVLPLVLAGNTLLIWRACRRENQRWFTVVFVLGFVAKLVGTLGRYGVAYGVYDGAADAERYNLYAAAHYYIWRDGTIGWEWSGKQGTQYMELITTAVYTVIGPSTLAAFVVSRLSPSGASTSCTAHSGSQCRTVTTDAMPCSCSFFPRCSTGRRASARRRG